MASVSAAIMAHPVREDAVAELQAQLDRPVPVVYDTNPVPSADREQRWRTAVRAWERAAEVGADWSLVIQDDIYVSQDFLAGVEAALTALDRQAIVSFYTGTGRPDQTAVRKGLAKADRDGSTWMSLRSLSWGPAIAIPTRYVDDMLHYCSTRSTWLRPANLDYRIGVWARDVKRWLTYYTVPSLVEHRGLPSLVGHDYGPKRQAHRFHAGSALDIPWDKTA